jgi:hypothetical protein
MFRMIISPNSRKRKEIKKENNHNNLHKYNLKENQKLLNSNNHYPNFLKYKKTMKQGRQHILMR